MFYEFMEQERKAHSAKIILQQCIKAKLKVKEGTDIFPYEFVEINRGIVVYVCFLKGANEVLVDKMVNIVTSVKLCKNDSGQLVSVVDLPGSILIVPQASLGGNLKGKRMQYHSNIDKDLGLDLYLQFVSKCKDVLQKATGDKTITKWGTYGNLQVLDLKTNGPYTHVINLWCLTTSCPQHMQKVLK